MNTQYILSVLVVNHPGVLARISGLFSRRGFNIDSLSVCESENPELSRMTILINGDTYLLDQVKKQLGKLVDVKKVMHFQQDQSLSRELLLVKVSAKPHERSLLLEAASVFNAKVIDLSTSTITMELTGESAQLNAFIELLKDYGIQEMARTGLTALERGSKCIRDYMDEFEEGED